MLRAGIVGLPNVGKSTLFNALTATRGAESASYPFSTTGANVGVVNLPDARLEPLAKIAKTNKIVHATVEVVDIAGLAKGASRGEGLGNQFLHHIRETELIVHVVRCFEDENVVHVEETINPRRDVETLNLELILADLATVEKRRERVTKQAKVGDKAAKEELDLLDKLQAAFDDGKPARLEDKVDQHVAGPGLVEPFLRRPLWPHPLLHKRLQRPFGLFGLHDEVEVVACLGPAPGPAREAACEQELHLRLAQRGHRLLQRRLYGLERRLGHARQLPG